MKKIIAALILLSFAAPVRAGLVTDFDPVEKKLLDTKQTEEKLNQDFAKPQPEPVKPQPAAETSSGSTWWKWALGIVVIGGVAAAAGGHGGGGGSSSGSGSSSSGGTGSTTVTW